MADSFMLHFSGCQFDAFLSHFYRLFFLTIILPLTHYLDFTKIYIFLGIHFESFFQETNKVKK